ncbi:hypothetical protein A1O3_09423 [Capronia epimyces CBS 606.96]|uniref:Uncharacterized protein n=1 Tax=Capronia epimyces CBS 606.96 TaxID=1182542 RepID=W9XCP6_9EURO|nr:uncharacterized protein A1O3_09423 [Capronia epimyces CBS 606.96]EXJ78262.1 hypothetical protein A1O3_09423 [Capronia epimyces CBS 606.96]
MQRKSVYTMSQGENEVSPHCWERNLRALHPEIRRVRLFSAKERSKAYKVRQAQAQTPDSAQAQLRG